MVSHISKNTKDFFPLREIGAAEDAVNLKIPKKRELMVQEGVVYIVYEMSVGKCFRRQRSHK